jgi:hypothetical protein
LLICLSLILFFYWFYVNGCGAIWEPVLHLDQITIAVMSGKVTTGAHIDMRPTYGKPLHAVRNRAGFSTIRSVVTPEG